MARIKPKDLLQQSKKKRGPSSRISAPTLLLCLFIVVCSLFFVYSSYRHWLLRVSIQASNNQTEFHEDDTFALQKKSDLPGYAVLSTSKGSITVELFKDSSPEVVDKFIDLCQKEHFKGKSFHRVIKHYVIQAGDPENAGTPEDWTSGKHTQLDTSLKHEAFMLGTSKTKTKGGGFELFITTAPIPDLTEKLIVFGRVVKGEDVVQEIEEEDTDEHYRPKHQIGIINVTLKQKP